jgi:hypothetical protein
MGWLWTALVLGMTLGACSGSDARAPEDQDGGAAYGVLLPETSSDGDDATMRFALPKAAVPLRVRLTAFGVLPVSGAVVEFSLLSGAKGASLDAQTAVTDADGWAEVILTTGSVGTEFQVRASAPSAEPLNFTFTVREARDPTLVVRVRYAGERPVAERTVSVVASMDCTQALETNAAGDKTVSFEGEADSASYVVGSGMRYAVVAWARDSGGGVLARGCTEVTTTFSASADKVAVDVVAHDVPLHMSGDFPIVVAVDLAHLGAGLAGVWSGAVAAALHDASVADEYALYTGALLDAFRARGGLAPDPEALRRSVAAAVATDIHGFGGMVASAIDARAASLVVAGTLTSSDAGRLTFAASRAVCSADDGVSLVPLALGAAPALVASLEAASASVEFVSLAIPLPLVGLVQTLLLTGPASSAGSGPVARIAERTGCADLPASLASLAPFSAVCDAACVVSVCTSTVSGLVTATEVLLQSRSAEAQRLSLSGALSAHARSEAGQVMDLGPSEVGASYGDDVTLPVTLRSASPRGAAL